MAGLQSRKGSHPTKKFPLSVICKYFFVSAVSFYVGFVTAYSKFAVDHKSENESYNNSGTTSRDMQSLESKFKNKSHEDELTIKALHNTIASLQKNLSSNTSNANGADIKSSGSLFDSSFGGFLHGVSKIERDDFFGTYDYGSPNDGSAPALLLYHGESTLPANPTKAKQAQISAVPMSAEEATKNCDFMHVVTVPKKRERMCTAVVQNFENWHVQKWMRQGPHGGPLEVSQPLRSVNRGMMSKGSRAFKVPEKAKIEQHWQMLTKYLGNFEEVSAQLKSIAEKVAVKNTIIVLTCNFGQSELLMNFVCNAKAKGLDVSNVLVFPTDQETKDLAESMGLATFHDEKNFGHLPKAEAGHYGDRKFVAMMFAKAVCVHMISFLGYDLLFQDVDIVWYKNPLEYFHDPTNEFKDFDVYFQDDGAHSPRYAPYSANSGFYYIRHNDLTRYFLTSLIYSADLILQSTSHQQALIQVMAEHASQFGMRVKVLSREMDEFPGGWHYNRKKKDFMKSIAKGEITPIIFHMSWTMNKDNKIKYLKQMGEWYYKDQCIEKTVENILGEGHTEIGALSSECCLAEANFQCYYRDKPSKKPCKDSPPIDKGHPSFW